MSSTGGVTSPQRAPLPPRPGTAPTQSGPNLPINPEPSQLARSPSSLRALGGPSAMPALDDVLEHPNESEQGRSSSESTAAQGSSTSSGIPLPSAPESATDPKAKPAPSQNADGDNGGTSCAGQPAAQQQEQRLSSSCSIHSAFASPFGTEASRPFSADVAGPSTGERRHNIVFRSLQLASPSSTACSRAVYAGANASRVLRSSHTGVLGRSAFEPDRPVVLVRELRVSMSLQR